MPTELPPEVAVTPTELVTFEVFEIPTESVEVRLVELLLTEPDPVRWFSPETVVELGVAGMMMPESPKLPDPGLLTATL